MEAISLNKPIVTCPSEFIRGRHTYSILKKLNIEETIASSKKKYVEIAVKLSKDNDFRNSIINKIIKATYINLDIAFVTARIDKLFSPCR